MKRRPGDQFRRRHHRRPLRTTVLIVGEGQQTERNYFHGMKTAGAMSDRFAVTIKKGPGFNPEEVVKKALYEKNEAEQRQAPFDEIWCVLDVEGQSKQVSLRAARVLARREGIKLCLSNPAFEVWILAHFARVARSYLDCDAVIGELNKHWKQRHKTNYAKAEPRLYHRLSPDIETAINNAKWVRETHHRGKTDIADCNSSTHVYLLVTYLRGGPKPSPEQTA